MPPQTKSALFLKSRGWKYSKTVEEERGIIHYWSSPRFNWEECSTEKAKKLQRELDDKIFNTVKTCSLCGKEYKGFYCKEHFQRKAEYLKNNWVEPDKSCPFAPQISTVQSIALT